MKTLLILTFLAGAFAALPSSSAVADQLIGPTRAAELAGQSASGKVEGAFGFVVRGTGRDGNHLFLNSEADYRSPTCLTVAVRRPLWRDVKALVGGELDLFVGKIIRVEGVAERVRVFIKPEVRDAKVRWYYQTHVRLMNSEEIRLVDDI